MHPRDFDYPSPALIEDPYPFYEALRNQCPVYELPRHHDYLLARHEDVKWAFNRPALFSSARRPMSTSDPDLEAIAQRGFRRVRTLVNNDPPLHRHYRSLAAHAFTPRRLRSYEPNIRAVVDELIDSFHADGSVEFIGRFANQFPMMVICDILGLPREMMREFKKWSDMHGELDSKYISKERAVVCQEALLDYENYLASEIEGRQKSPTSDVLSEIANTEPDDGVPLEMAHLVEIAMTLVTAGNETTASLMGNMMLQLCCHADQFEKLQRERSLIPNAVEESLRLETTSQFSVRMATQDIDAHGVTIPAGARVMLMRGCANRDGAVFEAADEFRVDRPNVRDHLGFGYGIHFCIGAPLARLEARIALERILDRMQDIELATDATELRHIEHPIFRSPKFLPLTFMPAQ